MGCHSQPKQESDAEPSVVKFRHHNRLALAVPRDKFPFWPSEALAKPLNAKGRSALLQIGLLLVRYWGNQFKAPVNGGLSRRRAYTI